MRIEIAADVIESRSLISGVTDHDDATSLTCDDGVADARNQARSKAWSGASIYNLICTP